MSYGLLTAVTLQIFFIIIFTAILIPYRYSQKITLVIFVGATLTVCVISNYLVMRYGTFFLIQYGFFIIGLPLFSTLYFLSKAKGLRFVFIALTAIIFYQIITVLLMVLRVYMGGFNPFYFLMNFVAFGMLLAGGYYIKTDFQKIVFTYKYEFGCLSIILTLLFIIAHLFLPITEDGLVDTDLLLITLTIDLLVFLLYIYIAINFHSLGVHCDNAKETLSLQYKLEEVSSRNALLQASQENEILCRHDLRHHISIIHEFLENGKLDQLYDYIDEVEKEMAISLPVHFCQNETANLLLDSFFTKAKKAGIRLIIDSQIPNSLPIGNTEFCTLLSNALENAITAVEATDDQTQKIIHLMIKSSDGKLLISVENPYSGEIQMENGLPQSTRPNHGFGIRSMDSIVKKHGGLSNFEAKNGIFTVRIII